MRFILKSAILIAAVAPVAASAQSRDDHFTAPRNATVNAAGARRIEIDASAGFLRVRGVASSSVTFTGLARASRQSLLPEIKLGGVDYYNVKGSVRIPDDRRYRRRNQPNQ